MVELYPQTDVWWYRSQRDAVLFNGKLQPEQTLSRAIDVFFSKEVQRLSSARGGGIYPALNQTILDACLCKCEKTALNIFPNTSNLQQMTLKTFWQKYGNSINEKND